MQVEPSFHVKSMADTKHYFEFRLNKNTYYNLAESAIVLPVTAQDAIMRIHKISLSKSLCCCKTQEK